MEFTGENKDRERGVSPRIRVFPPRCPAGQEGRGGREAELGGVHPGSDTPGGASLSPGAASSSPGL